MVMPRLEKPDKQMRLIANFLLHQDREEPSGDNLSLLEHPIHFYEEAAEG
jgi:hypothetical protein